jgi:hypothetical protein
MGNQKFMWIVWPAFLAACVLELLVFALVDPSELHWSGQSIGLSRQGVYTSSFFVFWAICCGCSYLTTLLRMTPAEVNICPFPPGERPSDCPQQ